MIDSVSSNGAQQSAVAAAAAQIAAQAQQPAKETDKTAGEPSGGTAPVEVFKADPARKVDTLA